MLLVLLNGCAAKLRVAGANEINGRTPVPLNAVTCGTEPAESLTCRDPVRVPLAVGENVTLMLQVAAGARDYGQLWDAMKSPVREIP